MLDLRQAFEDAELTRRPLRIDKKYYEKYIKKPDEKKGWKWNENGDSFWLPMMGKDEDGKMVDNGQAEFQIDITTLEFAEKNKVGSAREDPNIEPFLPPPIGRLSFSFNPFEMYKQLIGPAMRRKIAIWCCVFWGSICCVAILYYLVPIILGNMFTNWISHGF